MGLKITKDTPYQILFALCIGVTYLNIYELTFGIWMFALLLTVRKTYSYTMLSYVLPFVGILILAFISAFFYDHNIYESIRDFTYLIKPIIGLLIGYQMCRSRTVKPFETIIYTGVLIAVVHLLMILFNVVVHKIANIHTLRALTGFFSDFEVYALIILMFHKQLEVNFSKSKFLILVTILGLSSFLYLSRMNFIQFIMLFLVLKGYFTINRRSIVVFLSILVVALSGYAYIYNMNLSRNGKGMEALLYKIKNAPIEPFKTKVDKDDYEDFNDNYRSFENIITIKQVSQEGTSGILFGKGLGATIDIGRRMLTNDGTYVRHEPIVHNAYMTIFLKSGIVGVFFLIVFLYLLCKHRKSDIAIVNQVNLLLIGTGAFLIVANWVLLGLFLKLDNKAIIIGFLLCYKELVLKENRMIHTNTNH